ncbi:MAG: hypothetical protein ABIP79_16830 [Chitinophagaceae bacterium]
MKPFITVALSFITAISFVACSSKSGDGPATFCDTACLTDSIKFQGDHKLEPAVFIISKNCKADSIIWTYKGLGELRKTSFEGLIGRTPIINKDFIRCYFNNADVAWIMFNDCESGRGFQIKLPYDKSQSVSPKGSGINNLDPKFSISDNLVVYTDRGNLFIEDMSTGKKGSMTFGEALEIDYDYMHDHIDSVNVTNTKAWARVKIGKEWKVIEKNITLE